MLLARLIHFPPGEFRTKTHSAGIIFDFICLPIDFSKIDLQIDHRNDLSTSPVLR